MLFRQAPWSSWPGCCRCRRRDADPATRGWFRRVSGWMLALIFDKPAAAAVYATAFTMIGTARTRAPC